MDQSLRTAIIGLLASAAILVAAKTAMSSPRERAKRIEVAFVLDTTGSMEGLIDGAKRKIWSIANSIVDINPNADIRMGLIGYRDIGDDYVVRTHDMSADIQGLYGRLMKFQADGGGDGPESVNEALDAAVRDLEWSSGDEVRRIVSSWSVTHRRTWTTLTARNTPRYCARRIKTASSSTPFRWAVRPTPTSSGRTSRDWATANISPFRRTGGRWRSQQPL